MTDEDFKMETSAAAPDPIAELRAAFVKQAEIIKAQNDRIAAFEKKINDYEVKLNAAANAPKPAETAAPTAQSNPNDDAFYAAMREMGFKEEDIKKKE